MRIETADVLVVGAGPAGLAAAACLARDGVDAITVSKFPSTAHTPRAHITNQRAMEIFRDLGIEAEVLAASLAGEGMGTNVFATSVAGRELARMDAWGSGPERRADYANASPSPMCNIGQHDLEPILRRRAEEFGGHLRFSTELVAITQTDDHVEAEMVDRDSGEHYLVRAQYAVAADGGRSLIAEELGFPFEGETGLGSAINVWIEADLAKYREHRPGALFFTIQPGRDFWLGAGTFVTVRPWNEWVLIVVYDPETETIDTTEEGLQERIGTVIGDPNVEVRIKGVSEWQMNHLVATTYRSGRVFLAGDAAHRHPPANGLGSNTSVQDGYNIAWKLAHVVSGLAGPDLLDTYDAERQPVGRQVVDRALASVQAFGQVPSAFGCRIGQTDAEGQAALDEFFSDTPAGAESRRHLDDVLAQNQYHFNAHGVELGQRYSSTAAVTGGEPMPEYTRDRELYYQPTTWPGAYLPHVWVVTEGRKISTLDLTGGGEFTLLTGIGGEAWERAADVVSAELGVPIRTRSIGRGEVIDDSYGAWARAREVGDDGAVLVRPDRYIGWRAESMVADPASALRNATTSILSR